MSNTIYWKLPDSISYTLILSEEFDLENQKEVEKLKPSHDCVQISKEEYDLLNTQQPTYVLSLRNKRDTLLSQSDILYIRALESKLPKLQLDKLKEYRQTLRDITLQQDLNNIIWPTLPEMTF